MKHTPTILFIIESPAAAGDSIHNLPTASWIESLSASHQPRYCGEPLPPAARNENGVMSLLLFFFVFSIIYFCRIRSFVAARAKTFFGFGNHSDPNALYAARNSFERAYGMFHMLLLAVVYTLFAYGYAYPRIGTPQMFGVAAMVFGVLLLRYLLYLFINRIFFLRNVCRLWVDTYFFLTFAEAVVQFLLLIVVVCCNLFGTASIAICLGIILAFRAVLIAKSWPLLFGHWHGLLHFFAYFCGLEIAPLAVLWTLLSHSFSSSGFIF